MQDQEIILRLAQTLYDRKAGDISVLKVGHLTVLCDYMVIASGRTAAQVSALAEDADEMMAKAGVPLRRRSEEDVIPGMTDAGEGRFGEK